MIRILKTIIGLGALFLAAESGADTLNGKVVGVMSGDTLTIQSTNGKVFKVRLAEVDAPESSQAFGKQARQFTENLVMKKSVQAQFDTVDKYRRLIGTVILSEGRVLNQELVRNGFAWHYRVHYPGNEFLRELEYRAWKNKSGLWVDPSAVPPWKFRREAFLPDPPENPSQMDYDRILSYGVIGDPTTKLYQWPACRNYPKESEGFAVFGNFQEAMKAGFKVSPHCAGR